MYICTFPRMRTLKILCAAFAAFAMVALSLPSSAQNGRANGSSAQAELHINVIVVPVVFPPRHREHRDRDRDSVSYELAARDRNFTVSEEMRPMLVEVPGRGLQQESVQLTTVVVK